MHSLSCKHWLSELKHAVRYDDGLSGRMNEPAELLMHGYVVVLQHEVCSVTAMVAPPQYKNVNIPSTGLPLLHYGIHLTRDSQASDKWLTCCCLPKVYQRVEATKE